jgi:hypothetical protein
MEDMSSMRNVVCIRRGVRACKRLSEAAKTLATRDHVIGISGPSTLFNNKRQEDCSLLASKNTSVIYA